MDSGEVKYIVNEYGEVLEELGKCKVLKETQLSYLKDTQMVEIPFVKLNPKVIKDLKNITNSLILLDYIDYKTNILCYKNGRVIKKVKDLGKIFSKNEKVGYRKVVELVKDDVIHKYKDDGGTYFLYNPYIAHLGRRINRSVINDFKLSKWRRYSSED